MNTDMIQGIGFDKHLMPIYFYYGEKRYLFGLIKCKRFGTNIGKAQIMPSGEITGMVKRFGDKAMLVSLSGEYIKQHMFYLIIRQKRYGGIEYFTDMSASRKRGKRKVRFSRHVMKAYVSASMEDVQQSINTIRAIMPNERITYETIILNVENQIQQPKFMIYLHDVKNGVYRYLSKHTTAYEIRGVDTVKSGICMGYDEALRLYNTLTSHYSRAQYQFAVIHKPKKNVKASDLPSYQRQNHDTGRVQVGFNLNPKHHG